MHVRGRAPDRARQGNRPPHTAQVMAGPSASMADRPAAAEAEEKAILAWRHQPETEGAHPDLDAQLGDYEAGQ